MMGNTAFSYYSTSEKKNGPEGPSAWPEDAKTWPTLMMLGVSLMSLVSNAAVMVSYCCGQSSANRTDSVSSFFSAAEMVVHALCWGVSAVLFKQQSLLKGFHDLWSWSCAAADDERQKMYADVVNFQFLCTTNVSTLVPRGYLDADREAALGIVMVHRSCKHHFPYP